MYFISAAELKNKQNYLLIDVRADLADEDFGSRAYAEGHIEGAVFLSISEDLAGEVGEHGGRHPRKDMEEFKEVMIKTGLREGEDIVIYDEGSMMNAARLWIMLQELGLQSYIIKGGYDELVKAGFKVTAEKAQRKPQDLSFSPKPGLLRDVDAARAAIEDANTLIVDARSSARYLGLEEPFDKVAGHLPTAINIFWKDTLDGLDLKGQEELKELFKPVEEVNRALFQCGSGISAAFLAFAYNEMKLKEDPNFDISEKLSLYVGSFGDYVSYPGHKLIIKDGEEITL